MILVTGATGNAGKAVVRALLDRGEQVRGLVRDGAVSLPEGAARAVGELNRPDTLAAHLDGVDAVFLLSGYDGLEQTPADMRSAGVGRVVLLSSSAAPGGDLSNAVARYHILSERAVRESGPARPGRSSGRTVSCRTRCGGGGSFAPGDVVRLPCRRRCGGFDRPGRPRGRPSPPPR